MNPLSLNLQLLAQEGGAEEAIQAVEEVAASTSGAGWLTFLILVAILVLPFVLGTVIANALKLKEYATKIGIVLFALTLGCYPFVSRVATGGSVLDAISLGIDLAGGANMVFQVDRKAAEDQDKIITAEVMDQMVEAVSRRVNPTGTEEVTVRKVGNDRIEVIVPGEDREKIEQTKRRITNLGKLEFHLLANSVDHQQIIDLADQLSDSDKTVVQGDRTVGLWRRPAKNADGDPKLVDRDNRVHTRMIEENGKQVQEYLCVVDPDPKKQITGELLKSVQERVGQTGGFVVGFTFNARGGALFQRLTTANQPKNGAGYKSRLAILLNNEIHSAPVINEPIGASGQIDGQFTQDEISELIGVLNAGALKLPLMENPVSEFTVSPLLGEEVREKGFTAIFIALAAVLVVTLVYYLKAGFVADVCLAVNLLLVMGAMSLIDATFTLPGLAGLVLTIGMAVDANVLIFERMREEMAKGSSVRMSIKNGFEKAFSTIVDANVTTLLTAIVLYYIGTDQVKGFAVTLFIGILMSMFSALYVGRLIFDISEKKRWIKDLKMMSIVHAEKINFLGGKGLAAAASIALILIGLGAFTTRGNDNLDIDFLGGSMVTFKFAGDQPTVDEVRSTLQPEFESLALEQLQTTEGSQPLFRMRTTESNAEKVSQGVKEAFGATNYELVQQHVTFGDITDIPPADEGATGPPDLFAGGHEVVVTLSETMTAQSLAEEAQEALVALKQYTETTVEGLTKAAAVNRNEVKTNEIKLSIASSVSDENVQAMLDGLKEDLEKDPYFEEVNTFDSQVAGEMKNAAITAMVVSLVMIVAYLWVRFQQVTFGLAACVALVHDVLIVMGMLALASYIGLDYKINLPIVAAFLTIVGYSLNDTIVVFDRIREVRGRNPAMTESMINTSLNQTLSRTLLTSLTTLVVVVILYFMGGEGLAGFAFCLILGVLVGTYSSIYVASPALLWLMNRESKENSTAAAA